MKPSDKYGMLFSTLVYDKSCFNQLKGFHPLFEEIKKEGICLYVPLELPRKLHPVPRPHKQKILYEIGGDLIESSGYGRWFWDQAPSVDL